MPGKHRDNSTKINLERNLGRSSLNSYEDDESLWQEERERRGLTASGRPIVDHELERDADRASMAYLRKGEGHVGKGPKGYRRSDERIKEDVCEALARSYDVDATHIVVDVKEGCVYLTGEVDTRQTKKLAEDAVEGISGVVDVQNQLRPKRQEPKIGHMDSGPGEEWGKHVS